MRRSVSLSLGLGAGPLLVRSIRYGEAAPLSGDPELDTDARAAGSDFTARLRAAP